VGLAILAEINVGIPVAITVLLVSAFMIYELYFAHESGRYSYSLNNENDLDELVEVEPREKPSLFNKWKPFQKKYEVRKKVKRDVLPFTKFPLFYKLSSKITTSSKEHQYGDAYVLDNLPVISPPDLDVSHRKLVLGTRRERMARRIKLQQLAMITIPNYCDDSVVIENMVQSFIGGYQNKEQTVDKFTDIVQVLPSTKQKSEFQANIDSLEVNQNITNDITQAEPLQLQKPKIDNYDDDTVRLQNRNLATSIEQNVEQKYIPSIIRRRNLRKLKERTVAGAGLLPGSKDSLEESQSKLYVNKEEPNNFELFSHMWEDYEY
jgi:hypothetical protein